MSIFDGLRAIFRFDAGAISPTRPAGDDAIGWSNALTGQGYAAVDSSAATGFSGGPALTEHEICRIYEGDGIAARVIDLPIKEMLRQGWTLSAGDGVDTSPLTSALDGLQYSDESEHGLSGALERWLRWGALFGGSAIVLITDAADPRAPIADGERLLSLRILSRHDLNQPYRLDTDPLNPSSGNWALAATGQELHRDRLVLYGRSKIPRRLSHRDGWGSPFYVRAWQAITSYGTIQAAVPSIVSKFATPVMKIKGLVSQIAKGGLAKIRRLLGHQEAMRSLYRVLPIDADGEDFELKGLPVTGFSDLLARSPEPLSAVSGIPQSLLMGRPPTGLNATGESDITFFYDSLAAEQKSVLAPAILKVAKLATRTTAIAPEDISLEFNALRQMSDGQIADIEKKNAERDKILIEAGVYSADDVRNRRDNA